MVGSESFRLDVSTQRRMTAVDFVLSALRTATLRGDILGDSKLIQTEIGTQLGVSTTPVLEAMRDLASEGLITLDSHRVGTVRKPDWDEMVEIVELRRALEGIATTRAMANITPGDGQRREPCGRNCRAMGDFGSWVEKNIEFHAIFHKATRTSRLGVILTALEDAGAVFVTLAQRLHPEIRRRAVAEHYDLLEAYRAGALDQAVEIQYGHMSLPLGAFEMESQGDQTAPYQSGTCHDESK